jgi:hypothetical protein
MSEDLKEDLMAKDGPRQLKISAVKRQDPSIT